MTFDRFNSPKFDFMSNLSGRKNVAFPHCVKLFNLPIEET